MADSAQVLFITNSEYGQANVVMSVAQEVARNAGYQVHVATFQESRKRVEEINQLSSSIATPIVFHSLPGKSMQTLIAERFGSMSYFAHSPGILNTIRSYRKLTSLMPVWKGDEYMEIYNGCLDIIQKVNPAALVIDVAMFQAFDAADSLRMPYMVLLPTSAKDLVGTMLPGAPILMKWPAIGSGFRYPLSRLNGFLNPFLCIVLGIMLMTGGNYASVVKARKKANLKHSFPFFKFRPDSVYITPHLPEADWNHFEGIPSNVLACGPIIAPPLRALEDTSGDLLTWLHNARTVLINFGTHFTTDPVSTLALAQGIAAVLDAAPDLQILWKSTETLTANADLATIIGPYVKAGRVRITAWVEPDPAHLLETGHIVGSVHHGGANSFYEACKAGIPQLILPVWWDTYEYAERARYHGFGLIGNEGVAPRVDGGQFGRKLLVLVSDSEMRLKAAALRAACKSMGEGREKAASEVLKWAAEGKSLVVSG